LSKRLVPVDVDAMLTIRLGFCPAANNQVPQIFVVFLTGACPVPIVNPLEKKSANGKRKCPAFSVVARSWIGSNIDADDAHASGRVHYAKTVLERLRGIFREGFLSSRAW